MRVCKRGCDVSELRVLFYKSELFYKSNRTRFRVYLQSPILTLGVLAKFSKVKMRLCRRGKSSLDYCLNINFSCAYLTLFLHGRFENKVPVRDRLKTGDSFQSGLIKLGILFNIVDFH